MEKTKGVVAHCVHMGEKKRLPPIDGELKDEFVQDVRDRRGGVRGHLREQVETALREYLQASKGGDIHDRLNRIEGRLDNLATALDNLDDSDGGTDSVSKTTEDRIDAIMADIRERADELGASRVREDDVEAAIERNAGSSYKTIRRYEKLLQNQRELFGHPDKEDVYFVNSDAFIVFVEQNCTERTRNRIADGYGWEWWEQQAPQGLLDDAEERSGFQ